MVLLLLLSACRPAAVLNAITGCSGFRTGDHRGLVGAIQNEVDEQLNEPIPTLKMGNLISFDWDELHVFPPYTQLEEVAAHIGEEISCSRVSVTEKTLLVLTRRDEVVEALDWQNRRVDFSYLKDVTYTREDSTFLIDRAPLGRRWYVLSEYRPVGLADQAARVALTDVARRLYSLHGRPDFTRARAVRIARDTHSNSVDIDLRKLRSERFEIHFCLEGKHRHRGGTWHLRSSFYAPRTGSCPP